MRVLSLFLTLGLCFAEDAKAPDTSALKAQLDTLGVSESAGSLLGVGLLSVNDLRLLTAEDMKELKLDAGASNKINEWIDGQKGKPEIEIPVFSSEIEAKLQEEGIKSAADIRTLSEDDMMDIGMNIAQRNRVFNWIEHTAKLDEGGKDKDGEGEEDDEFYDDEEEEEAEAEEMAPEDPNKPRVRGFSVKMKRGANELTDAQKQAKQEARKKAKEARRGKGRSKAKFQKPKVPDNAPSYKVDAKGKVVLAAIFVGFFGWLFTLSAKAKEEDKKKFGKYEALDADDDILGLHLRHTKSTGGQKPTSKKAKSSKGNRFGGGKTAKARKAFKTKKEE